MEMKKKRQLNDARITRVCDGMMAKAFVSIMYFGWCSAGHNHDDVKDKAIGAK